ncbi:oligoribonuclease [Trypanosoma conorhini]|uniref:Oligoribonuclease n=1 Tax=Trypanosoma conorhini TaxID=83891 RepID=A0A3R7LHB2_9TRYP|nr:oligoribonuclease [Trypanosoma conorhini]RNF27263.1 oligoribonuclease [Trypanosoma conorhini]
MVSAVSAVQERGAGERCSCAGATASTAPAMAHVPHISRVSYFMMALALIAAVFVAWLRREEQTLVGQTFLVKPKFVVDGGSFYATTTDEGRPVLLRLRLLRVPALGGPHGRQSRAYLSQLLLGRPAAEVLCRATGADAAGGLIADVFVSSGGAAAEALTSVQEEMVRHGWAWAMEGGFAPNQKLRALMAEAREAKRGLWGDESSNAFFLQRAASGQKLDPSSHAAGPRQQYGSQGIPFSRRRRPRPRRV